MSGIDSCHHSGSAERHCLVGDDADPRRETPAGSSCRGTLMLYPRGHTRAALIPPRSWRVNADARRRPIPGEARHVDP